MVWLNLSGVIKREEINIPYEEFKKRITARYPDYKIVFMPDSDDWETCYILYGTDQDYQAAVENVGVNK